MSAQAPKPEENKTPNPAVEAAAAAASPATGAVPNLKIVGAHSDEKSLQRVLDIPLRVSVELGRAKILVEDLIKLHKGSVIELNKIAGDPLEILVNDRVVAKGEVIVMNEKFGVRLTDVVSHAERIRELGE